MIQKILDSWTKIGNFDRSDVQAAHPGGKVEVTERLKLAKLQFSTTLWAFILYEGAYCKVEKILKGSLDLIPSPSPSVKIQIIGGKVYLR